MNGLWLQVFAENKDELGLVLFGTDTTKNQLADDSQYQNITVHRHLMLPDFDLLEEVHSQIHPGSQQADCILSVITITAVPHVQCCPLKLMQFQPVGLAK